MILLHAPHFMIDSLTFQRSLLYARSFQRKEISATNQFIIVYKMHLFDNRAFIETHIKLLTHILLFIYHSTI